MPVFLELSMIFNFCKKGKAHQLTILPYFVLSQQQFFSNFFDNTYYIYLHIFKSKHDLQVLLKVKTYQTIVFPCL